MEELFTVLAAAENIPEWAPLFADEARLQADGSYLVTKNNVTFSMQTIANQAAGTVDYLTILPEGSVRGAYLRVVPLPQDGSIIVMTVPVLAGKSSEEVGTILTQELTRLLHLVEDESIRCAS